MFKFKFKVHHGKKGILQEDQATRNCAVVCSAGASEVPAGSCASGKLRDAKLRMVTLEGGHTAWIADRA